MSSNGSVFSLLALCAGNSPVTGEFPAQRPVTQSFDVFLICAWINAWANNHEAGDLRRHRAHYDAIVMNIETITFGVGWITNAEIITPGVGCFSPQ